MADSNSTHSLPIDSLNKATLKIAGASAIISAFGIFIEDTCGENGEMPVTGSLMSSALDGVRCLLESATTDLLTKE